MTGKVGDKHLDGDGIMDKDTLEFVHIPQSHGSLIEIEAAKHGISWGSCHFLSKVINETYPCPKTDKWEDKVNVKNKQLQDLPKWLVPIKHLKPNPYKGKKTFTVVRNPFDRLVSQYYNPIIGYKGPNKNNPTILNKWISSFLKNAQISQYAYLYDHNDKKLIDHVLKYENLPDEFNALMESYQLPLRLDHSSWKASIRTNEDELLTSKDLEFKTIANIKSRIKDEFNALGYDKWHGLHNTPGVESSKCVIAHYKHKSEQEKKARSKVYNRGKFMGGKIETAEEIQRREEANKINNTDMIPYVNDLHNSMNMSFDTMNIEKEGFFALVCIFEGTIEAPYMEEWLHWYLLQGVDHFYLYANENANGHEYSFLQPFLDHDLITLIPWSNDELLKVPPEKRMASHTDGKFTERVTLQNLAMMDFNLHFRSRTKWVIKVDVDEYARSKDNGTLRDLLKANPCGTSFLCYSFEYGSSGHKTKPNGLIIESYTQSYDYAFQVKSIAKADLISKKDEGRAHTFTLSVEKNHC